MVLSQPSVVISTQCTFEEMGEVGEATLQDGIGKMVKAAVRKPSRFIRTLEIGTSVGSISVMECLP